ncbi:conserved hypothetical protein [Methanolacinia petrolearia DSM 11571]|uniref:YkgJ family cysteine cluster protein n=1 Tax=Methanolacinia petrolearia (strain DSM 11571 / OCM 486 / SEBR 4847) TaxID=679926 RepID=E1RIB3_METP4|nr:hypothetical protein [Methanolacinia petrolearia]ADN36578.1 conserved hypothetical protein [Methanolacinia petrolearia DSM 11571]
MNEFVCTLCGRCCMGMGRYVKVTGVMGPGRYAVRHDLSNELFYATVDRNFRGRIDPLNRDTPAEWCPFLMDKDENGNYYCSIHDSIPSFCKKYKCCTCRISGSNGNPAGMVKGRSTIVTDDKELEQLWNSAVNSVLDLELNEQKKKIVEIMKDSGYDVRYFE